jgi:hypothetical protein
VSDFDSVADGIVTILQAGEYDGSPIEAEILGGTGEVRPFSVKVLPPALEFESLGEGSVVSASLWPLHIFTGRGKGEIDLRAEMDFTQAVIEALNIDPTLNRSVVSGMPVGASEPEVIEQNQKRMMRRVLTLRAEH